MTTALKLLASALAVAGLTLSTAAAAEPTADTRRVGEHGRPAARTAAEVAGRLTPDALRHRPSGVRPGARGTFRATIWPTRRSWDEARIWLRTSGLTGSVQTAHIHTGAPGKNGPVLVTLCDGGRCSLIGAGHRLIPAGTVEALKVLGGYVDVHTKRNPSGELRGQIVNTP